MTTIIFFTFHAKKINPLNDFPISCHMWASLYPLKYADRCNNRLQMMTIAHETNQPT